MALVFWILAGIFSAVHATPLRICVTEKLATSCSQMEEDLPEVFECIIAPDALGCLKLVDADDADITNIDPSGIYLGGKFYNLHPIVTELVDAEPFRYQGVALVLKESDIQSAGDLRNRTSCHTGFRRTVGWQIPVGRLLSEDIMTVDCEDSELAAVNNFFNGSCVPGDWSSDPEVDQRLKNKFSKLCSKCKNPDTCAEDDTYAGYQGVMNCLSEGAADVAFTKIPELRAYLEKNPEFAEKAELLCFEGGRKSVLDPEPCIWGVRPTNAFVAKSNDGEEEEKMVQILLDTQTRYSVLQVPIPEWYHKTFFSHPKVTHIRKTENERKSYLSYLGNFVHSIRKPRRGCEGRKESEATICVLYDNELAECEDYSRAAEAASLWPDIKCVMEPTKAACIESVKEDFAQLVVLDGGDVYKAARYFELQPIAGEDYNGSDASYYAVAVIRSASDVTKISELKGMRSCHTAMGQRAGWVMPVGILASEGLLSSDNSCSHAEGVAKFFSAGSCAPGANDTKANPDRVRSEDLCKHCVGNDQGQFKCASPYTIRRNAKERYSGYAGAFRCLAEGHGDVAFVKHTTVSEYTDGKSKVPWTKDLLSSDFMLLCDVGGTAPVSDFSRCNLGKVPSHQVVAHNGISNARRLNLAQLLASSSRYFSNGSDLYRLFRHGKNPGLLFRELATGLKITPFEYTYEKILGERLLEALKVTDPKICRAPSRFRTE